MSLAPHRPEPQRPDIRALYDRAWGARLTAARLASLVSYHPDGVFAVDLDGYFTSVNAEALLQSGGYAVQDLIGRHFVDLLVDDHVPAVMEGFAAILDGETSTVEVQFHRGDGSIGELEIIGLPIVVDGEVVEIFGIAEDITERKQAQHDLAVARVVAESANEAKSEFLATMSHEVRTPLTSVLAAAEMLADTELDPRQQHLLAIMERSGERLLRLVNDLLDFSRIEAGRTDLESVSFDLEALVDDTMLILRSAIDDKGIRYARTIDPGLPSRFAGDPVRIAQVLTNLVDNATKFTAVGEIGVRVTSDGADPTDPDGPVAVRFAVTDTGIGMTAEQQAVVCETFRQGDASTTRRHGGTGLGLSISQRLVTLMGGVLEVESVPGVGSTVSFVLPLSAPSS